MKEIKYTILYLLCLWELLCRPFKRTFRNFSKAKHRKETSCTYRKGKEKRVSGLTVSQEGWKEAGWLPLPLCMWTPPSGSLSMSRPSSGSLLSSSSSWAKSSSSHAFWRNLTVGKWIENVTEKECDDTWRCDKEKLIEMWQKGNVTKPDGVTKKS